MQDKKRPNLVFVLSDQHRFCDLGYAGNEDVDTPCLDTLAQESAVFDAAYSNCPLCVPARGSLLTGLHGFRHGAAANDLPIRPDCESIATVLDKAGYDTAYIGKWHLGGAPRDAFIPHYNRLDFRYWRAYNCNHDYLHGYYDDNNNMRHTLNGYAPVGETDLALEYLQEGRQADKPFAMFVCYGTPHDPYFLLPPGELDRYMEKDLKLRGNCEPELVPGEMVVSPYNPKAYYAGYYAHIGLLDQQIGRLVERLKEMGEYENTIFVYTSDHGDMLGSHGFANKQHYYEESVRVPLLISWPGHVAAGSRESAISLVDLAPTVLGMMGLQFETKVDGEDLSGLTLDPAKDGRHFAYLYSYVPCHQAEKREIASWRAITDGKQMLAVDESGEVLALFDNETDPLQMQDRKDDAAYAAVKAELKAVLDAQVQTHDGYLPWQTLLEEKQLDDLWEESEVFFAEFFAQLRRKRAAAKKELDEQKEAGG